MFGFFKNRQAEKPPPDVEAVFRKLSAFLQDEAAQNAGLPDDIREVMATNPSCESVDDAEGTFARSYTNPVPANGPLGQAIYLSSLRINGTSVMFHRLGSIANVDIFETVSLDGAVWDILYLSLYFPRRSRKAPTGYTLDDSGPMAGRVFGTTARVEPFPQNLYSSARDFTVRSIGLPLPNRLIREALAERPFVPPETHRRRVDELVRSRMTLALTDADLNRT